MAGQGLHELRWHPARAVSYPPNTVKAAMRGIDLAMIHRPELKIDRVEPLYPADRDAVRPVVLAHLRYAGQGLRWLWSWQERGRSIRGMGVREVGYALPMVG